jgi:uncharacterized protein with FMN-binding domain
MFPKRGAIALGLTSVALVLLVSFRTPTDAAAPASRTATIDRAVVAQPGASAGSGSSGGSSASASPGAAADPTEAGTKTVDGPVVDTRYGPVQVEITVEGSSITAIEALQLPGGDRRSEQISSRAAPELQSEALQAQSANIDGVSGATYTSAAYAQSLQAAIDDAGI